MFLFFFVAEEGRVKKNSCYLRSIREVALGNRSSDRSRELHKVTNLERGRAGFKSGSIPCCLCSGLRVPPYYHRIAHISQSGTWLAQLIGWWNSSTCLFPLFGFPVEITPTYLARKDFKWCQHFKELCLSPHSSTATITYSCSGLPRLQAPGGQVRLVCILVSHAAACRTLHW